MTNNLTQWAVELGNVTDLSFAGSTAPGNSTPTIVLGSGDYSTIFTGNETNSVSLPSFNYYKDAAHGFTFELESLSFG